MENKKMFVTKIDLDKFFSELADELKEEKINTLFSSLKSLLNNIKEVAEKQIENERLIAQIHFQNWARNTKKMFEKENK